MHYDPNSGYKTINNGSNWTTQPSTGTINTGFITNYPMNMMDDFLTTNTNDAHKGLDYIKSILDEYFDEFNVDIEEVTMKELFDYIIKKDAKMIKFVPQTVDRCKLALSNEWSKEVKNSIKLPFTGELHKFYLKMKLTHGSLK